MRSVREALKNIWREKGLSLGTIFVTTLTFFVTSVFILVFVASGIGLDYLESRAQLTAFFKDSATEEQIMQTKADLEKMGGVLEVTYTSKEEALEIYKEEYKDEPTLLESINANIFPASLDVRAESVEYLGAVKQILDSKEFVEEIVYFQDIAESFKEISVIIKQVGLGIVGVLSGISFLIILLSIGMSIHRKSQEISIMRLVGASNWHIQAPFILQGAFYCLVAVLLSFGLLLGLVPLVYPHISSFFVGMPLPQITPLFAAKLIVGELFGAALLGALGAKFA
ncbi:MAG: cell division protein FtsX, partial [Patescibacteria group bacterium]